LPDGSPISDELSSLLQGMLAFFPEKRISIDAAMRHEFFAPLFDEEDMQVCLPRFELDLSGTDTSSIDDLALLLFGKVDHFQELLNADNPLLRSPNLPFMVPGKTLSPHVGSHGCISIASQSSWVSDASDNSPGIPRLLAWSS
jgi:serine/threonine protein kinase